MVEIWKDIPGYEGKYQVSNVGRVKALSRRLRFVSKNGNESWRVSEQKILSQQIQNAGYYLAHLRVDNKRLAITVHSLVALAFLGYRPEGFEVNHKNGDKSCNRADNLEYVTKKENKEHAVRLGLNVQAKPVLASRDGIVTRYPSITCAAKMHGVTFGSIKYAINKKTICRGAYWSVA